MWPQILGHINDLTQTLVCDSQPGCHELVLWVVLFVAISFLLKQQNILSKGAAPWLKKWLRDTAVLQKIKIVTKLNYRIFSRISMGVRRLISRGGQNFPGGGAKTYYLPKKWQKHTIFFQKSQNTYYFDRPRGASAPSCPPMRISRLAYKSNWQKNC